MSTIIDGKQSDSTQTNDHVIPKARGGGNQKHNLRPTCYLCNQLKAGYDPVWFVEYLSYLRSKTRLLNRWHHLLTVERVLVFTLREIHLNKVSQKSRTTLGDVFKNFKK